MKDIKLDLYFLTAFVAGSWAVLLGWWVLYNSCITRGCKEKEDRYTRAEKEAEDKWQANQADHEWEASVNRIEEQSQKNRKEKKAKRAAFVKESKSRHDHMMRKVQRQADIRSSLPQSRGGVQ